MNEQKAAQALRTIIIGLDELADAFAPAAGELPRVAKTQPSGIPEVPPAEDYEEAEFLADLAGLPPAKEPSGDQGFAAICPKHRVPYKDGRYGLFCSKQTDDKAWGKVRDGKLWCSLTPKNAAKYLEIQAAA